MNQKILVTLNYLLELQTTEMAEKKECSVYIPSGQSVYMTPERMSGLPGCRCRVETSQEHRLGTMGQKVEMSRFVCSAG